MSSEHPNVEQIFNPTPCKGAVTQTKPTVAGYRDS